MLLKRLLLLLSITFLCSSSLALPIGLSLSYPLVARVPEKLSGWRASIFYETPYWLAWYFHVSIEGSYARWRMPDRCRAQLIQIYAFAPVLRYYFFYSPCFSPYLEGSIGPAYLSRTRFENRNLGLHFAFQDQIRIGAVFGNHVSLSVEFMHYSNACLSNHNSGITIPLMLNVNYIL